MRSDLAGRFAPSPTGDLHFGSLLAALASYCDIKHQGGLWHVRIDDIDEPRSMPGSASAILRSLERYGLQWDGPVLWQSQRMQLYCDTLADLVRHQLVFACNCSRRTLCGARLYPGNCVNRVVRYAGHDVDYRIDDHALRCRLTGSVLIDDAVQGTHQLALETSVGDIIVWRRDGLVSYALACAIDDAHTASHVVRGADLLDSTGAQIGIMKALELATPRYAHIPVAVDANGDKLSKHSKARSIDTQPALPTLLKAWHSLGQAPFEPHSLDDFWRHVPELWRLQDIPSQPRCTV